MQGPCAHREPAQLKEGTFNGCSLAPAFALLKGQYSRIPDNSDKHCLGSRQKFKHFTYTYINQSPHSPSKLVLLVSSFFSKIRSQVHCGWQTCSRTHSRAEIWAMAVWLESIYQSRSLPTVLFIHREDGNQPPSVCIWDSTGAQCVSYMHVNGVHSPLGSDLPSWGALGNWSLL